MLSRAIVPRKSHDRLAELIKSEMEKIVIGHSDDPATQLAPLAMKRQLERVESYVEEGRRTADLVTGGARPAHLNVGYFLEPTLFANVDNRSRIAQEEIFGPVLSLIPCDDESDAIRIANESDYGLNGAVFTRDADAAYRVARAVRTGYFGQNGMRMDYTLPLAASNSPELDGRTARKACGPISRPRRSSSTTRRPRCHRRTTPQVRKEARN
jgi:acyl-CoA reductase-like NAD-dependent aldehyde dehydrogenase